jgi:hypothetical protein
VVVLSVMKVDEDEKPKPGGSVAHASREAFERFAPTRRSPLSTVHPSVVQLRTGR